jgi:catechol 2,3-dioxygenase-like lactoylglutathione lyase family enzyme
MSHPLKNALIVATLLMAPAMTLAQPAPAPVQPAKPVFAQASMNVYRRFPAELRDRMVDFYGTVLGLQPLTPINLSPTQQMILFKVGTGQIKLASGLKEGRQYHTGGVNDATGIRLYTLYFPDEAALSQRFTAAGYPAPAFRDLRTGQRAALVQDPGGFNIELVIVPNAPPETYGQVEVGINVSDLDKAKAFYAGFVGLEELPPVQDPLLGVIQHRYRNGSTTIDVWYVGKGLPADTGSAGIQYVTSNVDAINALALSKGITVEEPLGGVPGFPVKTVWLNDPDGVTNYFYQLVGPRPGAAQ